ncbi:MAG: isoprenylcysteine carboxylmethyltransferase family protein [Limnochordales bacterium]|nr:protein-S-isoprenylcysteine methyltransferase [Bacillota bacterium]REJ32433.1 MAG: protein-S-isoprenylcysteine methyltransferase [Bacillota bacterium]
MLLVELRIPPPVVFLVSGLLMRMLAAVVPDLEVPVPDPARTIAAVLLLALGILCGALGLRELHAAGTTPDPRYPEQAAALVTGGIYRYTRNPMYLGMAVILAAWAVWLDNLAALLGVPAFVAYISRFQILPEERALAARFGAAYEAYRRSVRRWL